MSMKQKQLFCQVIQTILNTRLQIINSYYSIMNRSIHTPSQHFMQWDLLAIQQQQSRNVGLLGPVYIDSIIKEHKVSYLQHLCAVCEEIKVNPIWFERETDQNKVKMLQIYQMSMSYAANIEQIYDKASESINRKVIDKRKIVHYLREEIRSHKNQTDSMKKKIRKLKLLRERNIVRAYEKKMLKMREKIMNKGHHHHHHQTQQSSLPEEDISEIQHRQPHSHTQPQVIYIPTYPPYPPQGGQQANYEPHGYYGYHPQQPPSQSPGYPTHINPQQNPNFMPPQNNQNIPTNPNVNYNVGTNGFTLPQQSNLQQNILFKMMQNSNQKKKNDENILDLQQKPSIDQNIRQSHFSLTDSKYVKNGGQSNGNRGTGKFNGEEEDSLIVTSKTSKIKDSGINSEHQDQVNDLNDLNFPKKKKSTTFSRKQSNMTDSIGDIDSMLNINLGPQSNRNVQLQTQQKKNTQNKFSLQKSNQNGKTDPKKTVNFKQQLNDKQQLDGNKNYLLKSNQKGNKKADIKFFDKLLLKEDCDNQSLADSMLDTQSPRKPVVQHNNNKVKDVIQQQDNYEDDFENQQDNDIKINIKSEDTTPRNIFKYVSLMKDTFILKNDPDLLGTKNEHLKDSSFSSLIGSLRQLTVRGSIKRTTNQNIHKTTSRVSDFDCQLGQIQMPQNSRIAKPSYDKRSTIRKTEVIRKIANSVSVPQNNTQKNIKDQTNKVSNSKISNPNSSPDNTNKLGDSFLKPPLFKTKQQIKTISKSVQMRRQQKQQQIQRKNQFKKQQSKLSDIAMAQSHILQHHSSQSQLQLIDDPLQQQQKQQQQQKRKQLTKNKIKELIKNKYNLLPQGSVHLDTTLLKNQIKLTVKQRQSQLDWPDITQIYREKKKKIKKVIKQKKQQSAIRRSQIMSSSKIAKELKEAKEAHESNFILNNQRKNTSLAQTQLAYSNSIVEERNKKPSQYSNSKQTIKISSPSNLSKQDSNNSKKQLFFPNLSRHEIMKSKDGKMNTIVSEQQQNSNNNLVKIQQIIKNKGELQSINDSQQKSVRSTLKQQETPKFAMSSIKAKNIKKQQQKPKIVVDVSKQQQKPKLVVDVSKQQQKPKFAMKSPKQQQKPKFAMDSSKVTASQLESKTRMHSKFNVDDEPERLLNQMNQQKNKKKAQKDDEDDGF